MVVNPVIMNGPCTSLGKQPSKCVMLCSFFFSSRRRHTRLQGDWSSDVCSSDLHVELPERLDGGVVDVADFNGAKSIIDTAVEAFGKLDVLVNNAGILRDKMLFTMGEDEFDSVIRVHLKGTWSTMHHASAYWRSESKEGRQPSGSIVNTVSSAGLQGQASQSNYGAAKAGIAAMTIIASLELTRYGVRANCIGPGGFTRMVGQARQDITIKNPEEYTEFDGMNPRNSAPAVAWLASDESKPTTGQVLRMGGNSLCVYQPWQMGEEFLATDNEGKPARWDAADVGTILNKYVFHTVNPGIAAQQKR